MVINLNCTLSSRVSCSLFFYLTQPLNCFILKKTLIFIYLIVVIKLFIHCLCSLRTILCVFVVENRGAQRLVSAQHYRNNQHGRPRSLRLDSRFPVGELASAEQFKSSRHHCGCFLLPTLYHVRSVCYDCCHLRSGHM